MGTRSLTVMKEIDGTEIAVMYRQYDGYPSGHGQELVEFLKDRVTVNGFGASDSPAFNGGSCLAAQVVSHFKDGIGHIYLHPAGTRNAGEEYIYELTPQLGAPVHLKVIEVGWEAPDRVLYEGPANGWEVSDE